MRNRLRGALLGCTATGTCNDEAGASRLPPSKNGEAQLTDALRILLKKRPLYAFEFSGRRLDIGTKQDWMRANLILGLEQEPWRSTIEDVIPEHPEGRRIARRVAAAGQPAKARRRKCATRSRSAPPHQDQQGPFTLNKSLSRSTESFQTQQDPQSPPPTRGPPPQGP